MYTEIAACRLCGGSGLVPLANLGTMALTGIFPATQWEHVDEAPLELVMCSDPACALVQLRHTYDLPTMYGWNYGYRSGLNSGMVRHLQHLAGQIARRIELRPGNTIIDIGSNDSTFLQAFPATLQRIGVDPTGEKFRGFYPSDIMLIPEFFPCPGIERGRARLITSICCLYDIERPVEFVRAIADMLTDDGMWVCEQSYMPGMVSATAYDTICHEHLEYYGLKQIKRMCDAAGLCIVHVAFNDSNGGSFVVMATKAGPENPIVAEWIEMEALYSTADPWAAFNARIERQKAELIQYLDDARGSEITVLGYGASTKGNVMLQYCGITAQDLPAIAEVNPDKFGHYTPGTLIPIISEKTAREMHPDAYVVLPWHFKEGILRREREFIEAGGEFFFPLPR